MPNSSAQAAGNEIPEPHHGGMPRIGKELVDDRNAQVSAEVHDDREAQEPGNRVAVDRKLLGAEDPTPEDLPRHDISKERTGNEEESGACHDDFRAEEPPQGAPEKGLPQAPVHGSPPLPRPSFPGGACSFSVRPVAPAQLIERSFNLASIRRPVNVSNRRPPEVATSPDAPAIPCPVRPTSILTAGLAKAVDAVNQYAAAMQGSTEVATCPRRRDGTSTRSFAHHFRRSTLFALRAGDMMHRTGGLQKPTRRTPWS